MKKPVLRPALYFAICFAFTWCAWIFPVLASKGVIRLAQGPMFWILVIGSFGPFIAAFATLGFQGGRQAMKSFALRAVRLRVGVKYLLAAFFLVPLIGLAAALLHAAQGGPPFAFAVRLAHLPMLYVMLFFIGGSCGEEFGWAYALDALQERTNTLTAAVLLGAIWGCWHLPLFFIAGLTQSFIPFWVFLIFTISQRIIYTWGYEGTRKSIFTTLLFHTSSNLAFNLYVLVDTVHGDQRGFTDFAFLMAAAAIAVALTSKGYKASPAMEME
jgi:uncharacterized protein